MPEFDYYVPITLTDLLSIMGTKGPQAKVLAGGTDLLINLKKGHISPKYVVDISQIPELKYIKDCHDYISIGTVTTINEVVCSEIINKEAAFLSEAAGLVGAQQIRNSATIGGNLVNASPAADTVSPLAAMDAMVKILSNKGERWEYLEDFLVGPYQTRLKQDELVTELKFKKLPEGTGTNFIKLGRRKALTISVVSIAVALSLDENGCIKTARIAPGAVLPYPMRIRKAEECLIGAKPEENIFEAAGKVLADEMIRISGRRLSTDYKKPVVKNLVQRALLKAAGRCGIHAD
ncbi:MAG: xanthine dehydrogenase family protein subunit M [Dehalobacterium sp.]